MQACADAGVGHLVCVSIVGIEQVPSRYYRAKLAQEEIVKTAAGLPWTIKAAALALVNGWPGLVVRDSQDVRTVMSFTVDDGRIVGMESMRNPDKLTHVDRL